MSKIVHIFVYCSDGDRSHPGYPDAILSNGSAEPHEELDRLAAAIEARVASVGIFDGRSWSRLGATQNPQGIHTRAIGGRFYHLELRYRLRGDPARRSAIVDALAEAIPRSSGRRAY